MQLSSKRPAQDIIPIIVRQVSAPKEGRPARCSYGFSCMHILRNPYATAFDRSLQHHPARCSADIRPVSGVGMAEGRNRGESRDSVEPGVDALERHFVQLECGLGPVRCPELLHDVADVDLNRVLAHFQVIGDDLVRLPLQ